MGANVLVTDGLLVSRCFLCVRSTSNVSRFPSPAAVGAATSLADTPFRQNLVLCRSLAPGHASGGPAVEAVPAAVVAVVVVVRDGLDSSSKPLARRTCACADFIRLLLM